MKPHRKNLPNQPTQSATIEIEQANQNATSTVAFSIGSGKAALSPYAGQIYR
jgi:hypothetical protein